MLRNILKHLDMLFQDKGILNKDHAQSVHIQNVFSLSYYHIKP